MAATQKAVKQETPEKLSLEVQYQQRCAAGPAELLRADGVDGAKLSRYAFDASYQPHGPYIAEDVQSLTTVVQAHLAIVKAAASEKPAAFVGKTFDEVLVNFAKEVARGIHSHPGRYVQPDCQTRWVVAPQDNASAYLTSASAGRARWMSALMNHFPAGMTPSKLFISQFVFNDSVTTVSEMFANDSPAIREAFTAANVSSATVDQLSELFAAVFRNENAVIDNYLPQLLWPVTDGYLALTAVPALAVINSLASMRHLVPENQFVRIGSYAIGSGQPQNQSMAAVGTRGNIPLLDCEPPRVFQDAATKLVRLAHAGALLKPVGIKALQSFSMDVQALPNAKRARFFVKAARWHVAEALTNFVDLRGLVEYGDVQAETLPQGSDAQAQFVRGEPVTNAMATELACAVVEVGPATLFARHSSSDLVHYSEAVVAEIKLLGA